MVKYYTSIMQLNYVLLYWPYEVIVNDCINLMRLNSVLLY